MPLGDVLMLGLIKVLIVCWVLGWAFLIVILVNHKFGVSPESAWGRFVTRAWGVLEPVTKWAFVGFISLLALYFLASLLGWVPPLDTTGEPGDKWPDR